jgi:hypothetical protein
MLVPPSCAASHFREHDRIVRAPVYRVVDAFAHPRGQLPPKLQPPTDKRLALVWHAAESLVSLILEKLRQVINNHVGVIRTGR